jgi:hypothetical protein
MKKHVKRAIQYTAALFPSALPQTNAAYEAWADDVLALASLPLNDSFKQALATQVLHLGPTTAYKSKFYFILGLKAAVSKQAAYGVVDAIRQKEKAERESQAGKAVQNLEQATR